MRSAGENDLVTACIMLESGNLSCMLKQIGAQKTRKLKAKRKKSGSKALERLERDKKASSGLGRGAECFGSVP